MKRFAYLTVLFTFCFALTTTETLTDALVVVGRLVSVREGPGRSYSIVGQVQNGQMVKNLGTEGQWTKIGESAYIPSVYALPKKRVRFGENNVAEAKPLNEINTLINPVYQTTVTTTKITNADGTEALKTQTTTTHLETPVATLDNTNTGLTQKGEALPIVADETIVSKADKGNPNQVSTTTAIKTLEYNLEKKLPSVLGVAQNANLDTSTSVSTEAGSTLLGVLQSKATDVSELKEYTTKHIKSKTVVDSLNNIDAIYDTEAKDVTNYTADEFVKRYYKGTKKIDVVFDTEGKPVSGFVLTFLPSVGDIATEGKHKAIVKQVVQDTVMLIEQNHKWADKKKTGFYAPKNRRITLKNGIGIDSRGRHFVFYTPK